MQGLSNPPLPPPHPCPAIELVPTTPASLALRAFPPSPKARLEGPPEFEDQSFLPLLTHFKESFNSGTDAILLLTVRSGR